MITCRRRCLAGIVSTVLALGAILAFATPAQADHVWPINKAVTVEQNYGELVGKPDLSELTCVSYNRTTACYQEYGDVWYVRDDWADGHSAVAVWEDYSSCDTWTCHMYRQGICRNLHGLDTWARCNKNYSESHTMAFTAGRSEGWHVIDYSSGWSWVTP